MLRANSSLRGLADNIAKSKDLLTRRFHRSLVAWKRTHPPAPPFASKHGPLLLIVDGVWFSFGGERFVCHMILLRAVRGHRARLRGLVLLLGDECEANWRTAFERSLTSQEMARIKGIVADGSHGLTAIAWANGWKYQRCHFHLIKDLQLISGKRKGPTQWIRQRAVELARLMLDTPSEEETKRFVHELRRLLARPECPKTVRKKVGGFLCHLSKFRTCYRFPELRLPKTSNAAEATGHMIRSRLGVMRGVRTKEALIFWLDILLRQHPTIRCRSK